jgi:hypothetical protein
MAAVAVKHADAPAPVAECNEILAHDAYRERNVLELR